jgi:hypothetical protein
MKIDVTFRDVDSDDVRLLVLLGEILAHRFHVDEIPTNALEDLWWLDEVITDAAFDALNMDEVEAPDYVREKFDARWDYMQHKRHAPEPVSAGEPEPEKVDRG